MKKYVLVLLMLFMNSCYPAETPCNANCADRANDCFFVGGTLSEDKTNTVDTALMAGYYVICYKIEKQCLKRCDKKHPLGEWDWFIPDR